MKVVGFIPARSGSKGLPNKNIKMLHGKPLMVHSIDAALACPLIDEVYVSSDSSVYLNVARTHGAVPIHRPAELAQDNTSIKDVIMGTPELLVADAVVLLYPVYPLRNGEDLSKYVQKFIDLGGNRALTGAVPPKTHPYLCYRDIDTSHPKHIFETYIDNSIKYRRQDYEEYWEITLWSAVFPTKLLPELNNQLINYNTYFYKLPDPRKGSDIDTQEQFDYVEYLLSNVY